jgi:dynein light intermediate chain 1
LIFVITKSDVISSNNEKKRFEEDSEFIFKHIRNLALNCNDLFILVAATTIYTSSKYNYNLNVLYEYMLHRMYNFEFSHKPNIVDHDNYFIPSGYDSLSVLKGFDVTQDLEKLYDERIPKLKVKGQVYSNLHTS